MKSYVALCALPLVSGLSSTKVHAENKTSAKPNILFIVSEDNGPELGCYGTPIETPNLDALANAGTRFANAYVPQAGSSPSRACFLTGLYPHQNGQVGLATWKYHMYQETTPNLVNDLKTNGYRTGIIGKIHVNPESAFHFDWHEIDGGNFQRKNLMEYHKAAYNFITESDEPFYLQVNYPDAHEPFIPQVDGLPENPLDWEDVEVLPHMGVSSPVIRDRVANYLNCIRRLDSYIGLLIEELKRSGKYKNTLIVYIGDHGGDLVRGKRTIFEGGLRIPLIAVWPKEGKQAHVYDGLVSTLDLYPTFMDFAGISVRKHLPGSSMKDVIMGSDKVLHEYIFAEYNVHSNHNPYPQRSVRDSRYKLIYNPAYTEPNPGYDYTIGKKNEPNDFNAALSQAPEMVQQAYKRMKQAPEFELYDLTADPYEWKNLAEKPEYQGVLSRMKEILAKWQKETRDPFANPELAVKFMQQILDSHEKKNVIPYQEYMDPCYKFE